MANCELSVNQLDLLTKDITEENVDSIIFGLTRGEDISEKIKGKIRNIISIYRYFGLSLGCYNFLLSIPFIKHISLWKKINKNTTDCAKTTFIHITCQIIASMIVMKLEE